MGGKSARRENLPLRGCPNRSAFPGLNHLVDAEHTPVTNPDTKIQTPRVWSTEKTESVRKHSSAFWKTRSVWTGSDLSKKMMDVIHSHSVSLTRFGSRPWLVQSQRRDAARIEPQEVSKAWRCKARWERRSVKRNRAGSKQQLTNFWKVWVCSSDPGLETSFTLNCCIPSVCTQILLPSPAEPAALHTLPHAYKIHWKHRSKNTRRRGGS